MAYELGGKTYPKKGDVSDILSAGLKALNHRDRVTDPRVIEILNALIELDEDATDKIGVGIDHWIKFNNSDLQYISKGFRIMRTDGSGPVKFGYGDVLKKPTKRAKIQRALTDAALPITLAYRKAQFAGDPVTCFKTDELIENYLDAQAVHVFPPRIQLHTDFLAQAGYTFASVPIRERIAPLSGIEFEVDGLMEEWLSYQADHLDGLRIQQLDRTRY